MPPGILKYLIKNNIYNNTYNINDIYMYYLKLCHFKINNCFQFKVVWTL